MRPNDLFARMGGEEFACLLPDVTAQDAMAIAERVRLAFEATVHTIGEQSFGATVSVGVAFAAAERSDLPSLLVSADRALYRAKREGRNRVVSEEHVERALKSARFTRTPPSLARLTQCCNKPTALGHYLQAKPRS